MVMDPNEVARAQAYWNSADMSSPAPVDPVVASYYGPTPPVPDLGAMAFGAPPPAAAPAAPPPGAPPPAPSIASLRAKSQQMNAEAAGAPAAPAAPPASPDAKAAAAALAHYGGAKAPGGSPTGAGGARGTSALDKGEAGLRATYEADKGTTRRGAGIEGERADVIAVGGSALAQQKIDDQAEQQMEAANAARHFSDYSAKTQEQIDDVRAKRIEPNRSYADSGSATAAVIGGLLGGLYQGLNKLTSNPFIDQMNKTIDRDIAVQEANLRTQKEAIGERRSLLAEMRTTYKDEAVAKIQARNLYYEGAKEAIAARAADFDSPAIQARADQAINALSREQSKLDIQSAIRKAAQAQAAAAAAEHRRQVDFNNRLALDKAAQGWAELGVKSEATRKGDGKEHRAAVAHVGDKLAEIDKQGVATDVENLRKYLIDPKTGKVDTSRSIPGVGRLADIRETVAPPLGKGGVLDVVGVAGPAPALLRGATAGLVGLSDEERQAKGAYDRLFLGFKNLKTGAAASEREHARIMSAWEGAKTTAEVGAAVEQSYQWIQRNKDAIRAENPEATAEYEGNLREQSTRDQKAAAGRERP